MADVDIGKVRPSFEGVYSALKTYEAVTVVMHNGVAYMSAIDVPLGAYPGAEGSVYWFPIAYKGDIGATGLTGPIGPQGLPGPPWPQPPISDSITSPDSNTYASAMAVYLVAKAVSDIDLSPLTAQLAAINDRISVSEQVLHVQDQKPNGTLSGTFTFGARKIRDLNTIVINTIPGASLENNIITLPIGRYYIDASAPAFRVGRHRASLYDPTLNNLIKQGKVTYGSPDTTVNNTAQTLSEIKGELELYVTTKMCLAHRCEVTYASIGFGIQGGSFLTALPEIYSDVFIRRIS